MKKIITLIFLIAGIAHFSFSQKIGDNAEQIKLGAKLEVENYYRAQGYHQVRMAYDVNYFNGKISDVILCKENVPMIDLGKSVDFCTHFIMKNGLLANITTVFSNISLDELKGTMDQTYTKVANYYFDDSDTYYKVYLSQTGQVIKELRSRSVTPLPVKIQNQLVLLENKKGETIDNQPNATTNQTNKYFIGTKRFCDEGYWDLVVTIDKSIITIKTYPNKNNLLKKNKTTPTEIVKGYIKNGKIYTKVYGKYEPDLYKYSSGVFSQLNNENEYNDYKICK